MLRPGFFTGDVFDDFFDFPFFDDKQEKQQTANYLMKTDIKELEKGYELEIDLPGYKKEEIQAELKEGYLTIRAVKAAEQKKKKENLSDVNGIPVPVREAFCRERCDAGGY